MPVCLHNQQERLDVTAFLTSLRSDQPAAVLAPPSAAQRATGERLFTEVGCSKCHQKENHLDYVGSKYTSLQHLTDYIADPHALDPQGRMPRLFDPREERHLARAVAGYLLEQKRHPTPYPAVAAGDAQRGARLFYTRGCASCHALNRPAEGESALQPPAFGVAHDFTLRHYWDFEGTQQVALQDRVTQQHQQVTGRLAFRDSGPGRGAAFDFDGNSFIEVEHFPRPDTMTLSVWIQTTKGGSIVTWGRPQGGLRGSREWRMNIGQDGTNSICYGEYNSDGGWRPVIVTPTAVNLIDGQWHHLAVVRQGPTIQHYVDGRPQGTPGETHVGGGNYTNRLLVGALGLQQNPSNRFQGTLDDLSIWEIALGEEQIAALAAGRSPLEIAEPSVQEIEPFQVDAGCLAHDLPPTVPNYQLGPDAREDLRRFLRTVHPQAASDYHASPLTTHDLRIQQFRCTACHQYHDKNIQQSMQVDEEGRILRVEHPPVLTGVGAKLSSAWLREVLLEGKRNRPWLKVRMPHFGPGIRDLPDLLTRSAGAPDETQTPAPARELASAGLAMVGERRGQVACIACHDYRGINRRKAGVVPAPDIALAAHTVRRDWFQRWMLNPSRIQPGTSMPQMFLDLPGEQRALHIDQLWSALFYQDQLALPAGLLAKRTEGTRILVGSEPVIFRMSTKTPAGQVDRAINVGLPGGFNFTWDATQCRLVYVWKGDFLDAGPAWNGRGGNPVNAGNEALASLAEGHKLHLASEAANGPRRFLGYRLEEGLPVFRYALGDAHVEHRVNVSAERILQKFIVEHAPHDLLYVGDSKHRTRSPTAKQDKQDVLRFPQADRLLFQIEIPLDATSRLESK